MIFSQGDIIKLDFDPTLGHERAGYRPAIVISRNIFNQKTGLVTICPITSTSRAYPTRIPLDGKTETRGFVLCEQVRTIDVGARKAKFTEKVDNRILDQILAVVGSIIQKDD